MGVSTRHRARPGSPARARVRRVLPRNAHLSAPHALTRASSGCGPRSPVPAPQTHPRPSLGTCWEGSGGPARRRPAAPRRTVAAACPARVGAGQEARSTFGVDCSLHKSPFKQIISHFLERHDLEVIC